MSSANKPNMITDRTMKTLSSLKDKAPVLFREFLSQADKYQKASQALAQLGNGLAECVYKIGSSSQGDLGEGIRKLAEFLKDTETRREEVSRSILSDLIVPLKSSVENEQKEAVNFERYYKRDKDKMREEILKLENRTKKAGKKTTPEVLKQQISELNDKIKEAETMRANKLRDVVLLERKRYATFLAMWNQVLAKDHDQHTDALAKMKANEALWINLANTAQQLPREIDEMISKQERTFVQIQPGPSGGGGDTGDYRLSYAPGALSAQSAYSSYSDSSYDSYDSYDQGSYDSSYDSGAGSSYDYGGGAALPPPPPPISGGGGGSGARARALYTYESGEPSDLPLTANDIVTILQDDDGSGWTKGQDSSGRVGIFPTSYIEYI